jgi:hypothetical protein
MRGGFAFCRFQYPFTQWMVETVNVRINGGCALVLTARYQLVVTKWYVVANVSMQIEAVLLACKVITSISQLTVR